MAKKRSYPIINQNTPKDPITITNYFGNTKNRFQIKATREDWETLCKMWESTFETGNPSINWGMALIESFMSPIAQHLSKDRKKERWDFVFDIKILAGVLHTLFAYHFKSKKNKLPSYIKQISESYLSKNEAHTLEPKALTAYCIQSAFFKLLNHYKLKITYDNLQSFYITYIHEGNHLLASDDKLLVQFWCCFPLMGFFSNIKERFPRNDAFDFLIHLEKAFLYDKTVHRKAHADVIDTHKTLLKIFPNLKSRKAIIENYMQDYLFRESFKNL